jgi:2-oxoisovalerate dehydrogenase E1 component alpha subunit
VFVCENNGWAISVPQSEQMAVKSVADRASGYGMAGATVDGTDALAVYTATKQAVDRARDGGGPTLLDLSVPRLVPHSSQDDDAYRTDEERALLALRDPIPRLRAELLFRGVLSDQDDVQMEKGIREQLLSGQVRALARPEPDAARARRWLYAGDAPHSYRQELETAVLPPGVFE